MRILLLGGVAACIIASSVATQILPGHSIATVSVTGQPGEMYDIDHDAGTATRLTVSATLAADVPNCVMMVNPVNGFVGTNGATSGTANIYSITVQNGIVSEAQLNTTPTLGANAAQIVVLGGRVYFCTQNAGAIGAIQSVPLSGGPVSVDFDLATAGAIGLANALAELNGKIYCATFNANPANTATTPGELVEFDPSTGSGRLVMNLPSGGFAPNGNPWNTGIVNMHPDPLVGGRLVLQGVYGELLWIDPAAGTVAAQVWTGVHNAGGNSLASGSVNSCSWDPVAQDWVVGTRNGTAERWVESGQANDKVPGLGSSATASQNSVGGIAHIPAIRGSDVSYGPGCRGTGNWYPIDSALGAPIAGSTTFKFGLFAANAGDNAALLIDFQNTQVGGTPLPVDLAVIGAPGCLLRAGNLVAIGVATTGAGEGSGSATIPFSLPSTAAGVTLYRQWVELQAVPTTPLGIVVSNARRMTIQ